MNLFGIGPPTKYSKKCVNKQDKQYTAGSVKNCRAKVIGQKCPANDTVSLNFGSCTVHTPLN